MSDNISEKLSGLLGLCSRARMLSVGTELVCDSVRNGMAKLVLIAYNASKNTKKRITNCCAYYGRECFEIPIDSLALGHSIGKKNDVSAVAVNDRNMAAGIEKILNKQSASGRNADKGPQEV